jgi:hypothetical protein
MAMYKTQQWGISQRHYTEFKNIPIEISDNNLDEKEKPELNRYWENPEKMRIDLLVPRDGLRRLVRLVQRIAST